MAGPLKKLILRLPYEHVALACRKICLSGEENDRGLNSKEKSIVLWKHNKYRRKVARGKEKRGKSGPQPGAANMKKLVRHISISSSHFHLFAMSSTSADMEQ